MRPAFEKRDQEAYCQSLANYLPNDRLFRAKNMQGSNLRKLLFGLAKSFFDANAAIMEMADNISPLNVVVFLEEWEKALGIPDTCSSPFEPPILLDPVTLSANAGTVTAGTPSPHNYVSGITVKVRGASPAWFNGDFVIEVTGASSFTYAVSNLSVIVATGSPTCYSNNLKKSNADRQAQILAKLSYMACQTAQDFIDLAALLGFTITITPGIDDISGATAGMTTKEKRFTIVVNSPLADSEQFTLVFPIFFGNTEAAFLQCILRERDAANCQIVYNFTG